MYVRSLYESLGRVVVSGHLPLPTTTTGQHSPSICCHHRIHAHAGRRSCIRYRRYTQRAHTPLLAATSPSILATVTIIIRPARCCACYWRLLPNAKSRTPKCTGMAAPCQRHVSLTQVSKDSHNALLRDLTSISRGGGVESAGAHFSSNSDRRHNAREPPSWHCSIPKPTSSRDDLSGVQ